MLNIMKKKRDILLFITFLKMKNIYTIYRHNLYRYQFICKTRLAAFINPLHMGINAENLIDVFKWSSTAQGWGYWKNIDNEWREFFANNISSVDFSQIKYDLYGIITSDLPIKYNPYDIITE